MLLGINYDMGEDKFITSMHKAKDRRVLKNVAEKYNSKIFSKLQKLNLSTEQEEEIVHLLSDNDKFVNNWVRNNKD